MSLVFRLVSYEVLIMKCWDEHEMNTKTIERIRKREREIDREWEIDSLSKLVNGYVDNIVNFKTFDENQMRDRMLREKTDGIQLQNRTITNQRETILFYEIVEI